MTPLSPDDAAALGQDAIIVELCADGAALAAGVSERDPAPRRLGRARTSDGARQAPKLAARCAWLTARGPAEADGALETLAKAVTATSGWSWARTGGDIRAAKAQGHAAVLAAIDAAALGADVEELELLAMRGVRVLRLGAKGVDAPAPLALGELVAECERTGVVVDLAGLDRRTFWAALERLTTPPLVSCTSAAAPLDDLQLRAVAERGGCIGVAQDPGDPTLDAAAESVVRLVEIAGEGLPALAVAGWPSEREPSSVVPLALALSRRGLAPRAIGKVLGENALRVLDAVPPWGKTLA